MKYYIKEWKCLADRSETPNKWERSEAPEPYIQLSYIVERDLPEQEWYEYNGVMCKRQFVRGGFKSLEEAKKYIDAHKEIIKQAGETYVYETE